MTGLDARVVLLTGSAPGMWQAYARAPGRDGARVVTVEPDGAAVATELGYDGGLAAISVGG